VLPTQPLSNCRYQASSYLRGVTRFESGGQGYTQTSGEVPDSLAVTAPIEIKSIDRCAYLVLALSFEVAGSDSLVSALGSNKSVDRPIAWPPSRR